MKLCKWFCVCLFERREGRKKEEKMLCVCMCDYYCVCEEEVRPQATEGERAQQQKKKKKMWIEGRVEREG